MNILFYLTLLLVILSPFTELVRVDVRNDVAVHVPDVIAGIILVYWVGYLFFTKRKFTKRSFLHPILLFGYAGLLSLLVNSYWLRIDQIGIAALYLVRWLSYASVYFIIKKFTQKQKGMVIFVLLVEGFIITILGYIQYFFYPALKNLMYLGWDDHLYRLFSVFLDPNFAGIYFVLYLLLILGIFYSKWKDFDKKNRIGMSYLLLLVCGAIVLTYSRTALIMLIVGIVAFLILIKQKKWIFLVILCTAGLILFLSPRFSIENTNLFRTNSSEARLATSLESVTIIQKNPIFGVGFDAYRYSQIRYGFRNAQTPFPSHADAGVDNSYLFAFVTTGVIGIAAYLFIWVYFLRNAFSVLRQTKDPLSLITLCSFAAALAGALFINSLFYAPVMLWLWILMAI